MQIEPANRTTLAPVTWPLRRRRRGAAALFFVFLLAAPRVLSAQQPLPELSLEDLMKMDAGRVFGASERLQPVTEAPASVSFITAEEIARYGYRTLADILRGVRGMYVTDDRNFSLVGTRHRSGDVRARRDHPRAGVVDLRRQRLFRSRQCHHPIGRLA